jgi:hypothetical protein
MSLTSPMIDDDVQKVISPYGSMQPSDGHQGTPVQGNASLEQRPADQPQTPEEQGAPSPGAIAPPMNAPQLPEEQATQPESSLHGKVAPGQMIPGNEMHQARMNDVHEQQQANREAIGQNLAAHKDAIANLDWTDPNYSQKLTKLTMQHNDLSAMHGGLKQLEAEEKMANPMGSEGNHPGFFGKLAHGLGVMGNVVGHATLGADNMAMIPSSQDALHMQERAGQQEQMGAAKAGQEAAQTEATQAEVPLREAQTKKIGAETDQIGNEAEKPESMQQEYTDQVVGDQAKGIDPAQDPKTQQLQDAITGIQKQPNAAKSPIDQRYEDALAAGDHDHAARLLKVKQDLARAGQAPERPQRPQQQLAVINGKVTELRPGMDVPTGTESLSGELKKAQPSADETRRADLARNMNSNLDSLEEIVDRRPDLFGPVAGRLTQAKQFIGTSDPDVAKLKAIREYLGMASVGAHAMRNAQHVGVAADAVMAGLLNSPTATKGAIQEARRSTATFQKDAGEQPGSGPKNQEVQSKSNAGAKPGDAINGLSVKDWLAQRQK